MMFFFYNLFQFLLSPLLLVVLPIYLISRPEKCKSILPKLGYKLKPINKQTSSVVWIHALSVGEVTSVLPLVQHIKQEMGEAVIVVFSASTVSGYNLANQLLSPHCDRLVYAPLDILPVVRHFLKTINPDLFILVETDFWPNLLHSLKKLNIPALLVNGRVSDASFKKYHRFRAFFYPIMNNFDTLCMQTTADRDKMVELGISEHKIKALGNLKFAELENQIPDMIEPSPFPENQLIILAGSTHHGEEAILLELYHSISSEFSNIHLVLAPRNINRVDDIIDLVTAANFTASLYSKPSGKPSAVTIIDTIGDLSGLYRFGDICFIGGSLVDEGGHNPLEAARSGRVVLFGPHMDDFSEISASLIKTGGAIETTVLDIQQTIADLISSESERDKRGRNGLDFVSHHQHVVIDHMKIIKPYL